MNTDVTSTYTHIYVGGNFLTQSHPTHFHTFSTSRILSPDESPAHYREVTPEERQQIEAADAAWTRPPQAFIDRFNEAAGIYGGYNPATGYFELNGIIDITYSEAMRMLSLAGHAIRGGTQDWNRLFAKSTKIRTFFTLYYCAQSMDQMAWGNSSLEVLRFDFSFEPYSNGVSGMRYAFSQCRKLRFILGEIKVAPNASIDAGLTGMDELREIRLTGVGPNSAISLRDSRYISAESLKHIVSNKRPGSLKFPVHPDTFAKLTGDYSNPAAEALTEEERRQWLELAALAAESQTTFTA